MLEAGLELADYSAKWERSTIKPLPVCCPKDVQLITPKYIPETTNFVNTKLMNL